MEGLGATAIAEVEGSSLLEYNPPGRAEISEQAPAASEDRGAADETGGLEHAGCPPALPGGRAGSGQERLGEGGSKAHPAQRCSQLLTWLHVARRAMPQPSKQVVPFAASQTSPQPTTSRKAWPSPCLQQLKKGHGHISGQRALPSAGAGCLRKKKLTPDPPPTPLKGKNKKKKITLWLHENQINP